MAIRRRPLRELLATLHPPVTDVDHALADFRVSVDGAIVTNPLSLVRTDARIKVKPAKQPKGRKKLGHALSVLDVDVSARTCADIGACTGGFTLALLENGARLVYAVDSGKNQLLGSLRDDQRVVNLENTNLSDFSRSHLIDTQLPDLFVVDVLHVPLGQVMAQLNGRFDPPKGSEVIGLIKPTVELQGHALPGPKGRSQAVEFATQGCNEAGWQVHTVIDSAVIGGGGAIEFFVHATFGAAE